MTIPLIPLWFSRTLVHERQRLAQKGPWILVSLLSNVLLITLFTTISERYWPSLIALFGEHSHYYNLMLLGIVFAAFLINHSFYYLVSTFGLFRQAKVCKKDPWDDAEKWPAIRARSIGLNLLNILIVNPLLSLLLQPLAKIRLDPTIPSNTQIISHVLFCLLIQSHLFFLLHILGHRFFYKWHKVHHQFSLMHPLAAFHSDPIDYALGTVLPFAIGPILLGGRMHFLSFLYWSLWRSCQGISNHCGYDFKWSIFRIVPLSAGAKYHAFHHTHNIGNYGSFLAVHDTITETNLDYYEYIDRQAK